jgi:hypothetical protein
VKNALATRLEIRGKKYSHLVLTMSEAMEKRAFIPAVRDYSVGVMKIGCVSRRTLHSIVSSQGRDVGSKVASLAIKSTYLNT